MMARVSSNRFAQGMMNERAVVIPFLMLAMLAGCGKDNPAIPVASSNSVSATATVGSGGGTVTHPDGVQVEIPPGALSADTVIGITSNPSGAPTPLQEGNAPAGPIYAFTPHGIVFNTPVIIRLPIPQGAVSSEVFMANLGGDWTVNNATPNGAFAEVQRNSFSFGMVGMACSIPAGSTDPYPCTYPTGGATVTATPSTAITQIASGWVNFGIGSAGSWGVNPPGGTVRVAMHYRAAPDCSDGSAGAPSGRVKLTRWAAGVSPRVVTTIFDQTVGMASVPVTPPAGTFGYVSSGGGPSLRGEGSTIVDVSAHLGDATNVFAFSFTCRRAGRTTSQGGSDLITILGPMAPPSGPFTIGGTVSGLNSGASVVLQNNGGNNLTQSANGGFTFSSTIAAGSPYIVTVLTQPTGQTCTVQNGSGTANGDVTNVAVSCSTTSGPAVVGPLSSIGGVTCAIKSDRTVACWGDDNNYALGDGFPALDRSYPVGVVGLSDVVTVGVGTTHSCALKSDHSVWCWGANDYGQIGVIGGGAYPSPTAVTGLSGVAALSAGRTHNCVLKTDGTVACWGRNDYGQLGDGTTTDSSTPVAVSGLSGVVAVNAGWDRTCAITGGGGVSCWGDNSSGQLGNGSKTNSPTPTPTPVAVSGLTGAVAVSGGGNYHTCALKSDNSVVCWGDNLYGQLGNGANTENLTPVAVSGLTDAIAVSTGSGFSCATKTNGSMVCWGNNDRGELGDGTVIDKNTPVAVTGLTGVASVATGASFTCALKTDGSAACWGFNLEGYLGDGSTVEKHSPSPVVGGTIFWR